jgi:peptidoglycan/LPS O-acetylase OafA/YrhL
VAEEKRIYFRNLNALRFFAALVVIFHHIEQYKYWAKLPSLWGNTLIDAVGQKAVSFFFVLSGFLITYLLLEEHRKTKQIRVKAFYVRRLLRIWPVYYLVVVVCLVLPSLLDLSFLHVDTYNEKFPIKVMLLLLVLPNVLRVYAPSLIGGNQLWSIGVEEQFYLIWPLLVRSFRRHFVTFLMVFIAAKLLATVVLEQIWNQQESLLTSAIFRFWVLLKLEQLAIGAMGAWMVFERRPVLKTIHTRVVFVLSIVLLIVLMVVPLHHWSVNYFEAVVFLVIILNLSTNSSIGFSLETPLLNRLGNISYGIYMYHTLCITLCIYALHKLNVHQLSLGVFNVLLYTGSVATTLLTAHLSYAFFEKHFLNLKERFMVVKSGKKED